MKHIKVLIWVLVVCLVWFSSGCRTSRSLHVDQSLIDSVKTHAVDSMTNVQKKKDSLHQKEVSQLKAAGVVFQERPVPIYIPDNIGRDSLIKIIADLNGQLSSMHNEVQIYADGSLKAKGAVKSAYSTVEQKDLEIARLRESNDSLKRHIQNDSTHHKEQDITIDDKKKSGTGILPWIFLGAGLVLGFAIRHNKNRILSIFKIFNMKTLILFLLTCALMLTGCADFHNSPGVSVWSEGLWILPWLTGVGSIVFGYFGYKAWKSGHSQQFQGRPTIYSNKNVKWYKVPQFYYSAALLIATLIIIYSVVSNR